MICFLEYLQENPGNTSVQRQGFPYASAMLSALYDRESIEEP